MDQQEDLFALPADATYTLLTCLGACLCRVQTREDRIYTSESTNPRVSTLSCLTLPKPERCFLINVGFLLTLWNHLFMSVIWRHSRTTDPGITVSQIRCVSPGLRPENPGDLSIWASTQLQGPRKTLWITLQALKRALHLPGELSLRRCSRVVFSSGTSHGSQPMQTCSCQQMRHSPKVWAI